jgi:para-nitrobenzyl esterase
MAWVTEHIGAFGGDGGRLTIMGESAGGNSVLQHLTQPASFLYYQGAVVESGCYGGSKAGAYAEAQYGGLVARTTCGGAGAAAARVAACLRNLSAAEVERAAAAEMGGASHGRTSP